MEEAFQRQAPCMNETAAFQRMSATAEAAATVVDVLPEAHGLLHSWNCQVLSHLTLQVHAQLPAYFV